MNVPIPLTESNKIEVYTDGHCNLCRWMREHVEPLDRDSGIEWLDYNDPEILAAAPHTRERSRTRAKEMAEEMHASDQNGRWTQGYFAWIEVIRVLPRWKWLASIMSVWPFTTLGEVFYRGWRGDATRYSCAAAMRRERRVSTA